MLWLFKLERRLCSLLFCLVCLGPLLVLIGIIVFASAAHDTRGISITQYNAAVDQWTSTYRQQFASANFYVILRSGSNQTSIRLNNDTTKDTMHDSDSNIKSYTPFKWSIALNNVFSPQPMWQGNTTEVSFGTAPVNTANIIQSIDIAHTGTIPVTCTSTDTICPTCTNQGGVWNSLSASCSTNYVLSDYCLKTQQQGGYWEASTNINAGFGCGAGGNWNPVTYTTVDGSISPYVYQGMFTLRSAYDPYITLASLTHGTFNFGMTRGEKVHTGVTMIIVGGVFMLPAVLIGVFCYKHLSKKHHHHHHDLQGYAPVYGATAAYH